MLIIVVFCVIMSAFFSATETALSTFNKIKMKGLAERGNKRAALALRLSERFDSMISTVLIGNNIVNILASSLATVIFGILIANDTGLSTMVSTLVMTLVVLTFGEIIPKTLAKQFPERFAMFASPIIYFLLYILFPISIVFRGMQKLLAKIFKKDEETAMTEEDLIYIIEEAEEEGGIDEEESTLIKSAIEFADREVSEIFTPRIDIIAVSTDISKDELAEVFRKTGYSRLPIYDGEIDNIVGIVNYKDFYSLCYNTELPLADIVKPVMYVTRTMKISDLLKELQKKAMHMAIISDEYGSTAGIVTLEDILEEIVGEIWDEHDEVITEIEKISENEYIVLGKANLAKMLEELEIEIPEEDMTDVVTVNGWAMDTLGKIAETGDSFESHGLVVKVLKMEGRRIEKLHILVTGEKDDQSRPVEDE